MKLNIFILYICLSLSILQAMEEPESIVSSISSLKERLLNSEQDIIEALDPLLQDKEPGDHLRLLVALSSDPEHRKAFQTSTSNFLATCQSITSQEELESAVNVKTERLRKIVFDRLRFHYNQSDGKSILLDKDGPRIIPNFSTAYVDSERIIVTSCDGNTYMFSAVEQWHNKTWGIWDINSGKFLSKLKLDSAHDLKEAIMICRHEDTLSFNWQSLTRTKLFGSLCNIKIDGTEQHWYEHISPRSCKINNSCFVYAQQNPETSIISLMVHDRETNELIRTINLAPKSHVVDLAINETMLAAKIIGNKAKEITTLWNYKTGEHIAQFESPTASEYQSIHVKLNNSYMLFTEFNADTNTYQIIAYNYSTEARTPLITDAPKIGSIELFDNWLIFQSNDYNLLYLIDLNNSTIKQFITYTFPKYDFPISIENKAFNAVGLLDHYLITQAQYDTSEQTSENRRSFHQGPREIQIWNLPTGECLKTLNGNLIGLIPENNTIVYEPLHGRRGEFCKYELPELENSIKLMLATNNSLLSTIARSAHNLKWW